MSKSLLAQIINAFKPVPLTADSPLYVDLEAVREDANVFRDLGRKIDRNPGEVKYQLYAGHRGVASLRN